MARQIRQAIASPDGSRHLAGLDVLFRAQSNDLLKKVFTKLFFCKTNFP